MSSMLCLLETPALCTQHDWKSKIESLVFLYAQFVVENHHVYRHCQLTDHAGSPREVAC